MDTVNLYQLLDSAIKGEADVNFAVLRKLLRAMLEQQERYGVWSASAEPPTSSMDTPRSSLELEMKRPGQESIISELDQLWSQVYSLQGLASDLQGEKDRSPIRQLEDAVGKLREDGAKWKAEMSDQLSLLLGSALLETKQELEEPGETRKSMLDQLMSRRADQLQEQVDKHLCSLHTAEFAWEAQPTLAVPPSHLSVAT